MTPNPQEEGINERMKLLTARPFCPQCFLFLEEHDDNACNLRWIEEEQEEQEKLEQRMCLICTEVAVAGVVALAGWRLWIHRVFNIPSQLNRALEATWKIFLK